MNDSPALVFLVFLDEKKNRKLLHCTIDLKKCEDCTIIEFKGFMLLTFYRLRYVDPFLYLYAFTSCLNDILQIDILTLLSVVLSYLKILDIYQIMSTTLEVLSYQELSAKKHSSGDCKWNYWFQTKLNRICINFP